MSLGLVRSLLAFLLVGGVCGSFSPAHAQDRPGGIPAARVFFVAGDVAFASPSRGWPDAAVERGMAVQFWRGGSSDRRVVAQGSLFRVRPQHVAITLPPGSGVREGDLVAPSGDPISYEPLESAPGDDSSPSSWREQGTPASNPASIPAAGLRLLVYNIIQAPRLVAAGFDSHFLEALRLGALPGGGSSGENRNVILDAPERRRQGVPGPAEIRLQAMRHAADLVLVPVYVDGSRMDAVEVRVFDGRTGNPAGVTASPIRPIPSMVWTASGRRVGRLELIGRWSGIRPAPDAASIRRDGSVVVRVGGDLFTLRDGEAIACRDDLNVASRRRVSLGARSPLVAAVEPISFDETVEASSAGGDRVVLYDGNEVVFRSGPFATITGLVVREDLLLILAGDAVELLRLH